MGENISHENNEPFFTNGQKVEIVIRNLENSYT